MRQGSPTSAAIPHWLGRSWMRLLGWTVLGQVPEGGRFVLIGAPHTSNWDFVFTLATAAALRLRISWLGKDTVFRWPFGGLMRWLGGIPVKRDGVHGLVQQVADRFHECEKLTVAIAPCGTRKKSTHWKTGFYWIARTAQVPILCGYLDYARKQAGIGLCLEPTGDMDRDLEQIRTFYRGIQGKKPALACPIRFLGRENGEDRSSRWGAATPTGDAPE